MDAATWQPGACSWTINSKDNYRFTINGLTPGAAYQLKINNIATIVKARTDGTLLISKQCTVPTRFIIKKTE
jgi:hypothetical protein